MCKSKFGEGSRRENEVCMDSQSVVQQAKESFEKVLLNQKYSDIIKNDDHLKLLLEMLPLKQNDVILDV